MRAKHGGDWYGFQEAHGRMPLDYSANVSPFPTPKNVCKAISLASENLAAYPDPECRLLRRTIAKKEGVPPEWILCGNGAADLIVRFVLALKPSRALVPAPTFSDYQHALSILSCDVKHYFLREENGFLLQDDYFSALGDGVDAAFLCEPNNPTGVLTPMPFLQRVVKQCEETGTVLMVDECFNHFLDEPNAHTLKFMLAESPHMVLLKAFTKMYALAGARLGYVICSNTALLEKMEHAGQAWSVSTLAQNAGVAALQEESYVQKVRRVIQTERPFLKEGLEKLGIRVFEGKANYLLLKTSAPLAAGLAAHGILIRECENYPGLSSEFYRIAVRTREENERLLSAIQEVLCQWRNEL